MGLGLSHAIHEPREGATEGGFGELIAKMPKNMFGIDRLFGSQPSSDQARRGDIGPARRPRRRRQFVSAQNPSAGLDALKTSITQFAAAVTSPPMAEIGTGLQKLAQGIQSISRPIRISRRSILRRRRRPARARARGRRGDGRLVVVEIVHRRRAPARLRRRGRGGRRGGGRHRAGARSDHWRRRGRDRRKRRPCGADRSARPRRAAWPVLSHQDGAGPPDQADLERSRRSRLVWHGGSLSTTRRRIAARRCGGSAKIMAR